MFRSVLRPSSGVNQRALRNYYVSACLPSRIPVCGGMLSVRVYLRCTCQCDVWMCTEYTSRHHTDRYIASIHIQTTYRHKLECDEAGRLTRSNCARYGNWPLMVVGGLTETCWVFKINSKYASQTFLTCVVLNVNCESVLINKCMSW